MARREGTVAPMSEEQLAELEREFAYDMQLDCGCQMRYRDMAEPLFAEVRRLRAALSAWATEIDEMMPGAYPDGAPPEMLSATDRLYRIAKGIE